MDKCPELKATMVGDEVCYWCKLFDHPCIVEYNSEPCEEWEDIKKEWAEA